MKIILDKSKARTKLPRVLRAAVELFVEKGIDGTTTKDIAARSGVSEGAFYRHFKSKEELAWYVFSTHVNQFSKELMDEVSRAKSAREKLEAYVNKCFRDFEEDKTLFTYLLLSEHRELARFPADHLHPGHVALKVIKDGQQSGELNKMDIYVAASILVGSIIRLCVIRGRDEAIGPLVDYQAEVTESLWNALKK